MAHASDLGTLIDPAAHRAPIDVAGREPAVLLRHLRTMMTIRAAERVIARLDEEGRTHGPCHLGIGQEAVAAGVAAELGPQDRVFGTHRAHSQFLALGGSVKDLVAEILGRATGTSRGMGGSMHLYGPEFGFHGSVPIVAGTIPIAVGAALAAQKDGKGSVAVAFFGDGAAEEGALHEALNFAARYDVPVLFVCENNLYASHMDIAVRQPSDRVSRFADAHGIAARLVDGNDVLAVQDAAAELVGPMRTGGGPGFLEAVTFRWLGHVGPDENVDVGLRRDAATLAAWKERDPIARLVSAMVGAGMATEADVTAVEDEVTAGVEAAGEAAATDEFPPPEMLLGPVYAAGGAP